MFHRLCNFASLSGYLARRLVVDPLLTPARASSFRSKLQAMRSAETRETMIPVRSLTDLGLQPGRVVMELLPFTDGNPTPVELFCLSALVRASNARAIFEIGTFDGTTTLQLALNSPDDAIVWTLDLPAGAIDQTHFPVLAEDKPYIEKPTTGARFTRTQAAGKIRQLFGDSATFSFEPYLDRMDFVFIDGSHSLAYVRSDSARAFSLVRPGGWIVWHDYGVWPDVTTGLHELAIRLPLVHLAGTTLVIGGLPAPE
jgi:predicted O-methyltransferase YrrM